MERDDEIEPTRLVQDVHDHKVSSETLAAAGLARAGETLLEWAARQDHHPARVVEAWRRNMLYVRGHDRAGHLRCTLRRDTDPAFLNAGARPNDGFTTAVASKPPAALQRAEREYDRAKAEQAEDDEHDDAGHVAGAKTSGGREPRAPNHDVLTMSNATEVT